MKYYALILFLFLLSSCNRYYYIPEIKNVPLFKEKDEYRLSLNFAVTDDIQSADLQTAYSITDHFAVSSSLMFVEGRGYSEDNAIDHGKGNYVDFALGYYKPIHNNIVFEVFGGLGTGSQYHQYLYRSTSSGVRTIMQSGTANLAFTNAFLQPSIGLTLDNMDIAITTSFKRLNFHQISNEIKPINKENYDALALLSQNKSSFLIEPSFTVRFGWKYIKLQFQGVYSYNVSHSKLPFADERFIIGIQFAFAERFSKKL